MKVLTNISANAMLTMNKHTVSAPYGLRAFAYERMA